MEIERVLKTINCSEEPLSHEFPHECRRYGKIAVVLSIGILL